MGGLALSAMADPKVYTAPARQAALARFDHQVDPKRVLPPEERSRRAEAAKKLHFTQLAFASVKARTKNKTAEAALASAIKEAVISGTSTDNSSFGL